MGAANTTQGNDLRSSSGYQVRGIRMMYKSVNSVKRGLRPREGIRDGKWIEDLSHAGARQTDAGSRNHLSKLAISFAEAASKSASSAIGTIVAADGSEAAAPAAPANKRPPTHATAARAGPTVVHDAEPKLDVSQPSRSLAETLSDDRLVRGPACALMLLQCDPLLRHSDGPLTHASLMSPEW